MRSIGVDRSLVEGRLFKRVGLFPAASLQQANIIFYCDDDSRWERQDTPGTTLYPKWWDPYNSMLFDLPGKYPACLGLEGETKSAATYRKVYRTDTSQPIPRAAITICSASYRNKPYLGFFNFKGQDPYAWFESLGKPNMHIPIDHFRFLSVVIVQQVGLYLTFLVPIS